MFNRDCILGIYFNITCRNRDAAGTQSLYVRARFLGGMCNMSRYREVGVRERTQGHQLRLETAPNSSNRFLIVTGVEP